MQINPDTLNKVKVAKSTSNAVLTFTRIQIEALVAGAQ